MLVFLRWEVVCPPLHPPTGSVINWWILCDPLFSAEKNLLFHLVCHILVGIKIQRMWHTTSKLSRLWITFLKHFQAWHLQPDERPTFHGVKDELGRLKSKTVWTDNLQLYWKRNGSACVQLKFLVKGTCSQLLTGDGVVFKWLVRNLDTTFHFTTVTSCITSRHFILQLQWHLSLKEVVFLLMVV